MQTSAGNERGAYDVLTLNDLDPTSLLVESPAHGTQLTAASSPCTLALGRSCALTRGFVPTVCR